MMRSHNGRHNGWLRVASSQRFLIRGNKNPLTRRLLTLFVVASIGFTACGGSTETTESTNNSTETEVSNTDMDDESIASTSYEDTSYSGPRVSLHESHGPEEFEAASGSTLSLKLVGNGDDCARLLTSVDGDLVEYQVCAGAETPIGDWRVGLILVDRDKAHVSVIDPDGKFLGT